MSAMNPRFDVRLQAVLEQLYLDAVATVRWEDLYMWFDAKRLNKRAYRFILQRWDEFCADRGYPAAPKVLALSGTVLALRRAKFDDEAAWEELASWAE